MVTEDGITMLVRDIQLENAMSPMAVTEVGMEHEDNSLQSWKALAAIDVTELGMMTDVMYFLALTSL